MNFYPLFVIMIFIKLHLIDSYIGRNAFRRFGINHLLGTHDALSCYGNSTRLLFGLTILPLLLTAASRFRHRSRRLSLRNRWHSSRVVFLVFRLRRRSQQHRDSNPSRQPTQRQQRQTQVADRNRSCQHQKDARQGKFTRIYWGFSCFVNWFSI